MLEGDALRNYIRMEVRAALAEELQKLQEEQEQMYQAHAKEISQRLAREISMQAGLPAWARMEVK